MVTAHKCYGVRQGRDAEVEHIEFSFVAKCVQFSLPVFLLATEIFRFRDGTGFSLREPAGR